MVSVVEFVGVVWCRRYHAASNTTGVNNRPVESLSVHSIMNGVQFSHMPPLMMQ